jgi:hypothetical protein
VPKITEALIPVKLAKALSDLVKASGVQVPDGDIGLLCPNPDCRKPVKPHEGKSAHFEHVDRNAKCPLSHKSPKRAD